MHVVASGQRGQHLLDARQHLSLMQRQLHDQLAQITQPQSVPVFGRVGHLVDAKQVGRDAAIRASGERHTLGRLDAELFRKSLEQRRAASAARVD
ncbi:MAG: hypothetical protein R3C99_18110 [Pirellulaceae bacterium]